MKIQIHLALAVVFPQHAWYGDTDDYPCYAHSQLGLLQYTLCGVILEYDMKYQMVPNVTVKLLPVAGYRDQIMPVLKEIYGLPICFWAQLISLVIFLKKYRI